MKKLIILSCLLISSAIIAQNTDVSSPDGDLKLCVSVQNGNLIYSVTYNAKVILENSPLGLITNEGDFSKNMSFVESTKGKVDKTYKQEKIKQSTITYEANTLKFTIENAEKNQISILFQVSNNDIAFRYELPVWGETLACVVEKEITGYKFPSYTTTFLSSMMKSMTGFARTAPSYESSYTSDSPIETNSAEDGYVFPGLFHIGDNGWALLSETGVSSLYCGSHLSKYNNGIYNIEYPNIKKQ